MPTKKRLAKNPPMELMISVMLHRMDNQEWTAEELSPIKDIKIMDITPEYSAFGCNDNTFQRRKIRNRL